MMINKRLIALVGESKRYVAGNVAAQWCALAANIAMIASVCRLLERLHLHTADAGDVLFTAGVAVAAVAVRFGCNLMAARMGYLSSRAVKRTLRELIDRKLLGLARAFLHDAPFLLLDEPTSNLDSLNEAVILRSLREEGRGKTVVLVSHRASTMRIADDVYSVEKRRMC